MLQKFRLQTVNKGNIIGFKENGITLAAMKVEGCLDSNKLQQQTISDEINLSWNSLS